MEKTTVVLKFEMLTMKRSVVKQLPAVHSYMPEDLVGIEVHGYTTSEALGESSVWATYQLIVTMWGQLCRIPMIRLDKVGPSYFFDGKVVPLVIMS